MKMRFFCVFGGLGDLKNDVKWGMSQKPYFITTGVPIVPVTYEERRRYDLTSVERHYKLDYYVCSLTRSEGRHILFNHVLWKIPAAR